MTPLAGVLGLTVCVLGSLRCCGSVGFGPAWRVEKKNAGTRHVVSDSAAIFSLSVCLLFGQCVCVSEVAVCSSHVVWWLWLRCVYLWGGGGRFKIVELTYLGQAGEKRLVRLVWGAYRHTHAHWTTAYARRVVSMMDLNTFVRGEPLKRAFEDLKEGLCLCMCACVCIFRVDVVWERYQQQER